MSSSAAIGKNPFAKTKAKSGEGQLVVSLLPPGKQLLTKFEYQYPLKLISPDPHTVALRHPERQDEEIEVAVTTVFLLTYGGGLLAGDSINLTVTVEPRTRLALLTQGSTKIFKADSQPPPGPSSLPNAISLQRQAPVTSQILNVRICDHGTLCYLPDPNQPYAKSTYEQRQTFYVSPYGSSSLLFLDWVSEGRTARNEKWSLTSWKGRNEVREFSETDKGRLLLRDSLLLFGDDLPNKTDGKGIFGTLVIYGPVWQKLGDFFMREFKALPRIGAKTWERPQTPGRPKTPLAPKSPAIKEEDEPEEEPKDIGAGSSSSSSSYFRLNMAKADEKKKHHLKAAAVTIAKPAEEEIEGLLWTAAPIRGFVLVKFSAREIDGARRWLGGMLKKQGCVEKEMGHQALLCLK